MVHQGYRRLSSLNEENMVPERPKGVEERSHEGKRPRDLVPSGLTPEAKRVSNGPSSPDSPTSARMPKMGPPSLGRSLSQPSRSPVDLSPFFTSSAEPEDDDRLVHGWSPVEVSSPPLPAAFEKLVGEEVAAEMDLAIIYIAGLDTSFGVGNVRRQLSVHGFEMKHFLNISLASEDVIETLIMMERKESIMGLIHSIATLKTVEMDHDRLRGRLEREAATARNGLAKEFYRRWRESIRDKFSP
jgi:hypothetical protein